MNCTMFHKILLALAMVVVLLATGCSQPRKGYEPTQPIPFSHYVHSGQHEISCQYCHTAPAMGRHSTLPSTNICMNCHTMVAQESEHIQRLKQMYENNERIEWVKVHDLPDFAYFNHQPHVAYFMKNEAGNDKPGQLQGVCANCHGQVNTMEVVKTVNEFNMGWCVNCHRQYGAPNNCVTCHR